MLYLFIEGVSIHDLAVAYSSQMELNCWLIPPQGYPQLGDIKVKEMRRTKKPYEHILVIDYHSDLNGPGEDCTTHHAWRSARVRYHEIKKKGREYWLKSHNRVKQ
ncbi:MAG: hypothetical protein AAB725_02910 [Patescibacteria group bacterium]